MVRAQESKKQSRVSTYVKKILSDNDKRNEENGRTFNPITGEGSIGKRKKVVIKDHPLPAQYLPVGMLEVPLVKLIVKHKSMKVFCEKELDAEYTEENRLKIIEQIVRIRIQYDFAFWAALLVHIKKKGGDDDILFRLTRPQRKFVEKLEELRLANKPIRIILLKARQWGGSTTSQLYMAWLQLVHKKGLNSLIVAHQGSGSDEIKDMFDRMIKAYPIKMLHELGEIYNPNEPKLVGVGKSGAIYRVPQRNCKIKIGTAERPNGCRGGDYNLVHLSEVGIWVTTKGKSPEDMVGSACSGVPLQPYTMIVYESTANGTGNFFQREYDAAKKGISQFEALFISWFDIDLYSLPFENEDAKIKFATELWKHRDNTNVSNEREESGKYLWYLWELGATLEAIHWYVEERKGKPSHSRMASEYPSDDVEAFVHSGARVFDKYLVAKLKKTCCPPQFIGDMVADGDEGEEAFKGLRFVEDAQGCLWIWKKPEIWANERVTNRYLVVVDICKGSSDKADYSVITVFDRFYMIDGDKPSVVAQWYGRIDMDILAWKSAQIAAYYDNALLVIESNTLETGSASSEQGLFILDQIKDVYSNLYAREQSPEDIAEGAPKRYGWHTNRKTKPVIIHSLVKIIRKQDYVERDERCLDEYLFYERKEDGRFGAIDGKHDDLLMTRAIGLYICYNKMDIPKIISTAKKTTESRLHKKVISEASI
jgi:hypothetical protein